MNAMAERPTATIEKRLNGDHEDTPAQKTRKLLSHVVTRGPVGQQTGVGAVLEKNGILLKRCHGDKEEDVLAVGAACSEVFSGQRLAKVLRPAVEHQQKALASLELGEAVSPISIHTSAGLPPALGPFLESLSKHLPWSDKSDDWICNLQLEGTTAVWAAVEVLMHIREADGVPRPNVGVADNSYHGPKTTGLGQPALARWPQAPRTQGQVSYPRPAPGAGENGDTELAEDFLTRFDAFLTEHGDQIGVIIFEPQWGSSNAARPWPVKLLQEAVRRSRSKGILVLCDEIMCGLGRHGKGTLFLSEALELEPDAVTFGKAVAAGAYPLSGVVTKRGATALNARGRGMAQSHTYAASSELALLTAREVLQELPQWFEHAARMGAIVEEVLRPVNDGKFMRVQGLGLMWGGLFCEPDAGLRTEIMRLFREACVEHQVWPYFIPVGGFMVSPPMDVSEDVWREGLTRLLRCCQQVLSKVEKC